MAASERGNCQPRPGLAESRGEGESPVGGSCPWGAGAWSGTGLPRHTDRAAAFELLTATCSSHAGDCPCVRPSLVSLKQSHCQWVVPRAPLLITEEPAGQFELDRAMEVSTFDAF